MNKPLKRINKKLYYIENNDIIEGKNKDMVGDCSNLTGDCSNLTGDCSGLIGDFDEITKEERLKNNNIEYYIK